MEGEMGWNGEAMEQKENEEWSNDSQAVVIRLSYNCLTSV